MVMPTTWCYHSMSPGGEYTWQSSGNQVRVLSPANGVTWEFIVPDEILDGFVTMDGNHAVLKLKRDSSEFLENSLAEHPFIARFTGTLSGEYIALYRKPGYRVAIWRSHISSWWPTAFNNNRLMDHFWFPSPDGRSFAMTIHSMEGSRCFLFRYGRETSWFRRMTSSCSAWGSRRDSTESNPF
jgi:hypothetical protein